MKYAVAAILMLYGLAGLIWPNHLLRAFQGSAAKRLPEGYVRASGWAIRLLGLATLVAVPALFLLGLDA